MASNDDDGDEDGVFGRKIHPTCDCTVRHNSSYQCVGCGVCYFKALEVYNTDADEPQPPELVEASKRFAGLTFGAVYWFCSECKSMMADNGCILNFVRKSMGEAKSTDNNVGNPDEKHLMNCEPERDTLLLKLSTESNEMKEKLDDVLDLMEKISGGIPISPARKAIKLTFHDGESSPSMTTFDVPSIRREHLQTSLDGNSKMSYSDKVRVNIKSSEELTSSDLLKGLHEAKSDMPDFTGRKNLNGSIDVLFKSFDDANKAKTILNDKLKGAVVDSPAPAKLTRFNLVGIPFNMSISDTVSSLVDENKHWLDLIKKDNNCVALKNDPLSCIYVHSISKCKNNDMYRAAVSISGNMLATLGQRKLAVSFVKCKLYEWKSHRRCYKCQQVGHYSANCKNKVACSKCAGEHYLKDCPSDSHSNCVNCSLHSGNDSNHPSYSPSCPFK